MNSDVLFHSLLLIMLPYKCKAGSTMTRLFLFFIIWWLAWKAGQRYAQNIMSQVQQMLTMTVQSYLRKLHMEINRNGIIFTHHKIPMWAVNMRNSQSTILKHLNYKRTLGLSWRENIPPPFSFSLSTVYNQLLVKVLLSAVKKQRGFTAFVQCWEMYH